MNDTQSQPPAAWRPELDALRTDLEQLRRDIGQAGDIDDEFAGANEDRIAALEEILYACWPRRIAVRRRLMRDLRASVAHFKDGTFAERRRETIGSGWIAPLRKRR